VADSWQVVAEPVGANPGLKPKAAGRTRKTGTADEKKTKDNVGGVVVYLVRGVQKEEVARVGFIRKTSENPTASFEDKLDEVIETAKRTADTLNKLTPDGDLL